MCEMIKLLDVAVKDEEVDVLSITLLLVVGTFCQFFYESITEETNFRIMFICFMFVKTQMCMFCIVFNLCKI